MDRTNKRIIISLIIFLAAFFGIIFYLTYFQLFLAKDIKNNPYNRRNRVDEENVIRGTIYDRKGTCLLYTSLKKSLMQNFILLVFISLVLINIFSSYMFKRFYYNQTLSLIHI